MSRPGNVYEYDDYPMINVPKDRKPLPKEEEDKIMAKTIERVRQLKEAQELEKNRKIS